MKLSRENLESCLVFFISLRQGPCSKQRERKKFSLELLKHNRKWNAGLTIVKWKITKLLLIPVYTLCLERKRRMLNVWGVMMMAYRKEAHGAGTKYDCLPASL